MNASTFAFVLVLAAAVVGAALSIISLRLMRDMESRLAMTESALRNAAATLRVHKDFLRKLSGTAPAGLAAQVVELSDAVARLAKTQQRFAGKFYASGARDDDATSQPPGNVAPERDPELDAILALQSAPPVAPGA